MSLLTVFDPNARWQWVPPGQDGCPADARVVVVCRYPCTRDYLATSATLRGFPDLDGDQARMDALLSALRPIVVSVRRGEAELPGGAEALLDVSTPLQLSRWAVQLYHHSQLSELERGKSEWPPPGAAVANADAASVAPGTERGAA